MKDKDDHPPLISILTIIMVIAVVAYELVTTTVEWAAAELSRMWRERRGP